MASGFAQWGNDLYTGKRSYDVVGNRRRFYLFSGLLVLVSLVLLVRPGLNPGIDFRGGSQFTVSDAANLDQDLAVETVQSVAPDEVARVTTVGGDSLRIQTAQLASSEVAEVRDALAAAYDVPTEDVTSEFIGPTWGQDVSEKAITGLGVFLLLVMGAMTLYFRNWRMAAAAIIALFHDLIVTMGIYAAVGWEVTPATVIGFLTILAYSIYDTVVVFDKVRENTADALVQTRFTYAEKANLAMNQTLVRSINTSVVALLPVLSILVVGAFILGAGTLRDIALSLFVGMLVGTYSSIFLATPLEVSLREREPAVRKHTAEVLARRAAAATEGGEHEGVLAGAPRATAALRPGGHLGQAAQPRRKQR
ncbi:protein translocase subunit SecF [Cellulomonas shaoxiangyii]|uniref:Protein-export membrane protein SecF n=1 Tax=Cellulomonas shaoxiangyii TaxID=2566013 RepID=A0A4P7SJK4_9CELL|nr:protein translocase subunit SecF [Cellulomonas shaoxiangyii]QCB93667.1 protein translocase subunit SecF [Cellulomonas shaoxiangyii]TGY86148.1 protein translocase subunit SecF [Cellulomonas shaoxiangyii]